MKLKKIEILEKDNNKKGDLFGRLMKDLFHTLGYDEPRLNIHKSGREIDLNSIHRTEQKVAIAECKAHADPIGGSDINKFVGVVDAERRKLKKDNLHKNKNLVGYFISISGFRETAIEQENEFGNNRVILIRPDKLVEELIRGRIIVSKENALSSLSGLSSGLSLVDRVDLLAYDKGWIWVIYFSDCGGQKTSHFGLVHAEGKPLLKSLAEEIEERDRGIHNVFHGLKLLNTNEDADCQLLRLDASSQKYFNYLKHELGEIQFEGLPTDKEAGSVKVKLENIFVPLHFTKSQKSRKSEDLDGSKQREGIGEILAKNTRLALLAKPGGGKSTLIKRIAISYAFPNRRLQINDGLPEKNWFPIFLRCRELGEKVTLSITEIINTIPIRAEIQSCSEDFSQLVSNSLQNGSALLLIDGLDEIAEDKNRITFINQLRTFIATYPTINIIVTSREAGFRVVAGSLASYCENYTVSNLIEKEIEELCLKWHKAIIDDSDNTVKEAVKLSDLILKDSRIRVLAENPLLLTTLLFVKRWAGYLPTKRSVLYQEMIKLLLVTWNVEGHEILDIEEAEPQLCFVAYWMMKSGKQTITAEELSTCLIDARKQMPEILGYTNVSPSEFIKRVESRSSLLILSGHKRSPSGQISAVYEFLHLSFQEYLTAKALVKKYIPQIENEKKIVDILKPNINNENWKEVIPLAAVLLEREAKPLIEYLIEECKLIANKDRSKVAKADRLATSLLGSCLANEVQITPDLLDQGIEWYAKNAYSVLDRSHTNIILKNKFGVAFRKRVRECFFWNFDDKFASALGSMLGDIYRIDMVITKSNNFQQQILNALEFGDKEEQCMATFAFMGFSFSLSKSLNKSESVNEIYNKIFEVLLNLLNTSPDNSIRFAICWAVSWSAQAKIFPEKFRIDFVRVLSKFWVKKTFYSLHRVNSWALNKILSPNISIDTFKDIENLKKNIEHFRTEPENEFDELVSVFFGLLLGEKIENSKLTAHFKRYFERNGDIWDETDSEALFMKAYNVKMPKSK